MSITLNDLFKNSKPVVNLVDKSILNRKRMPDEYYEELSNRPAPPHPLPSKFDVLFVDLNGKNDGNYSVEDAMSYRWKKANSFTLEELINGTKKPVMGLKPPPEDFVNGLNTANISNEVDWISLKSSLENAETTLWSSNGKYAVNDVNATLDKMAVRIAAVKDHITNNFTGNELEEQLKKLDETVAAATKEYAEKISEQIGGYLDELGADGQKEKVYNSIVAGFNDKVKQYSDFISKNSDYAGLKGTENEWLLKDDAYMAARLKESFSPTKAESSEELYSLRELSAASQIVEEMNYFDDRGGGISLDEEATGFNLAALSLKLNTFALNSGLSKKLSSTIETATNEFAKRYVNKLADITKNQRPPVSSDKLGLYQYNTEDSLAVYNDIMNKFNGGLSAEQALKYGSVMAKAQHDKKVLSGNFAEIYRYGRSGSGFWKNFYDAPKPGKNNIIKIENWSSTSESENLTNDWNRFMSGFSVGWDLTVNFEKSDFNRYA